MTAHSALLDLPREVLQNIFAQGDLQDLARWSCTCRYLNHFVQNNTLLFKELYLRHLDEPRRSPGTPELDWETELPNVVRLEKLLLSRKIIPKTEHLTFISEAIVSLLKNAAPGSSDSKASRSRNLAFLAEMFTQNINVDTIICCSSLFEQAGDREMHVPANSESERQLSAKLHCLYGVPVCAYEEDETATHPYARARVYDLRRYTEGTLWGPFLDDGSQRVDWEKVEAIMVVLAYNLKTFHDRTEGLLPRIWIRPWWGATPYSFVSPPILTKQPAPPTASLDPYGITGTWMRIVCFLDYAELFAFNFALAPLPLEQHREPIDIEEATRLIGMRFEATKIEPPGQDDGPLPIVHFTGNSRSLHAAWDRNADSDIQGTVRLTREGEVRWTTFSVYNGEPRWRSEGIQVGGIQSARGVLGTWFDKDYDQHGPAGPTAFWKVSNEVNENMPRLFQF